MIYTFKCECGYNREVQRSIKQGPPARVKCIECGEMMKRDWQSDMPMIDTSKCRDHDFIPHEKRVVSQHDKGSGERMEREFQKALNKRRSEIRDAGGQRGSIRQTHSIPAHLYHGKIKETGDPNYWKDQSNLEKHKSCKVE